MKRILFEMFVNPLILAVQLVVGLSIAAIIFCISGGIVYAATLFVGKGLGIDSGRVDGAAIFLSLVIGLTAVYRIMDNGGPVYDRLRGRLLSKKGRKS